MDKAVAIVAPSFFDTRGGEMMMGGGERYLIDLYRLLVRDGFTPTVIQCGSSSWKKEYKGMPVIGIPNPKCLFSDNNVFSSNVARMAPRYNHMIYFRFDFAGRSCPPHSIGVSHGIWWDYPGATGDLWRTDVGVGRLKTAVHNLGTVVSVDTNTINWMRTMDPLVSKKMKYIPNYVDLTRFVAQEPASKVFTVLFARRPVSQRGYNEAMAASHILFDRYGIVFRFLGKGGRPTSDDRRATHRWVDLDDMPQQYAGCNVALIPSLGAEGTSFSCLEAMASRRPVIASYTGGLSNLVIDNYNGLLIQPTTQGIVDAVEKLYLDRTLTRKLGLNAYNVAQEFSKERWENAWLDVIHKEFK